MGTWASGLGEILQPPTDVRGKMSNKDFGKPQLFRFWGRPDIFEVFCAFFLLAEAQEGSRKLPGGVALHPDRVSARGVPWRPHS